MPTTATHWVNQLNSDDEQQLLDAVRQLAQSDHVHEKAAVGLIQLTGDKNESIREWAVEALEKCTPGSSFDYSSLHAFLTPGSCDDQCWQALKLISRSGSDAQELFPLVLDCCTEERPSNVRIQALKTVSRIAGSEHREELRALLETSQQSSDPKLVFAAASLLAEV